MDRKSAEGTAKLPWKDRSQPTGRQPSGDRRQPNLDRISGGYAWSKGDTIIV